MIGLRTRLASRRCRRARFLTAAGALASLALVASVSGSVGPSTTTLVSTGPAGGNGDFPISSGVISADGSRVFFSTYERLVSTDTDSSLDVYERRGSMTTIVSTGPAGGNGNFASLFKAISADGSHVFFYTSERLVSADTDNRQDLYERSGDATTLVSPDPIGDADFFGDVSADGSRVFFTSDDPLVAEDTDDRRDVYQRFGGTTTLVSTGPAGGNSQFSDAGFGRITADGSHVFFTTDERLVSTDTDDKEDLYERFGGTTKLVSTGPAGGNSPVNHAPRAEGVSVGGARVFFSTSERLVSADTDPGSRDVYMRVGILGDTVLVSTGPAGGEGEYNARFEGASADGSRVFFSTSERLVSTDTDSSLDVYERTGTGVALVSAGRAVRKGARARDATFEGTSSDGTRVHFSTSEPLVSTDTDAQVDVYERSGGSTKLVTSIEPSPGAIVSTRGNGSFPADFNGASADGARVYFSTSERLVGADTDNRSDVYMRSGTTIRLVSIGPASDNGDFHASFRAVSADGSRMFFETAERLVSTDTDSQSDFYRVG